MKPRHRKFFSQITVLFISEGCYEIQLDRMSAQQTDSRLSYCTSVVVESWSYTGKNAKVLLISHIIIKKLQAKIIYSVTHLKIRNAVAPMKMKQKIKLQKSLIKESSNNLLKNVEKRVRNLINDQVKHCGLSLNKIFLICIIISRVELLVSNFSSVAIE